MANKEIRVLNFDDQNDKEAIRYELNKYFKANMVVPVLGSGFTVGEPTKNNKNVPSGQMMKDYMLLKIKESIDDPKVFDNLENETFSNISTVYNECVSQDDQRCYLKKHFIDVCLATPKQEFLSIPFQNIYTLNIDDAIESSNDKIEVFLNNRPDIDDDTIADYKAEGKTILFKLHGDATERIKYRESLIFNRKEYIASLSKNKFLLNYLSTDLTSNCPMYIGCSLDDEIDLLYSVSNKGISTLQHNTYYVTCENIDFLMKIKLRQHGIDTVIKLASVEQYNDFYIFLKDIYSLSLNEKNSEKGLSFNPIVEYFNSNDRTIEEDLSYLINSSYVYKEFRNKKIVLPSFFISRDIILEQSTLDKIRESIVTIIYGHRYSGKTFVLLDIYQKFSSDNKIFIPQNTRADSQQLINKFEEINDSVFFIDANVLDEEIINYIIDNREEIVRRRLRFVFTLTSADKDNLFAIYSLEKLNQENFISKYYVKNILSNKETEQINKGLDATLIGRFATSNKDKKVTILDNILRVIQNKKFGLKKQISVVNKELLSKDLTPNIIELLIMLAIKNGVITVKEVDRYRLGKGAEFLDSNFNPLVQFAYIDEIERKYRDNSAHKFLCNSNVWLLRELQRIASYQCNHQLIVRAYQNIVRTINEIYLSNSRKQRNEVGKYIKFDEINDIFSNNKGARKLIDNIYEGLLGLLKNNIQYFHQRAKSLSWGDSRNEDLEKALGYIDKAKLDYELEYPNKYKLQDAYKHICYTRATILAKIAYKQYYKDKNINNEVIEAIHDAFSDFEKSNINYIEMSNELGEPNIIVTFIKRVLKEQNYDTSFKPQLERLSSLLINEISTQFNVKKYQAKKKGRI